LGHYPIIRRYCEEDQIYAVRPGKHVANKPFVARDIDNSCLTPVW